MELIDIMFAVGRHSNEQITLVCQEIKDTEVQEKEIQNVEDYLNGFRPCERAHQKAFKKIATLTHPQKI